MKILVLNVGSSSLKYQLFDMPRGAVLSKGIAERIGKAKSALELVVRGSDGKIRKQRQDLPANKQGYTAAFEAIIAMLTHPEIGCIASAEEVGAVGHRVVHGGEKFAHTTRITQEVKEAIKSLSALAPLHNPANLGGIETAEQYFPKAVQVAVFDTAFHQTMPPVAYRMALPDELYRKEGVRAYGFHGTSHQYVARQVQRLMDGKATRLITLHLGNGCSAAAIKNGEVIDTSMGLGPLGGLMMGTRAGDVDPSVLLHLLKGCGYSPTRLHGMLNNRSGLKGLTGRSDMRDVKKTMMKRSAKAKLAYEMYVYRIVKYVGGYVAALGGLDALVFTGGVGENDVLLRTLVCEKLSFFGIESDIERNAVISTAPREISTERSSTKVFVIPTNEELEIARQTADLLKVGGGWTGTGGY